VVLPQILGILLISGVVIFTSMVSDDNLISSQRSALGGQNQPHPQDSQAVLGITDTRGGNEGLFKREVFFGSGQQTSQQHLIEEEGIEIFPEDRIKVFPEPELGIGFVMSVTRALPVRVIDGNDERLYRTFQTSVKGLLDEKGIELGSQDMIEPALTNQLEPGIIISIVRVSETEIKTRQKIDFATEYRDDPNLDKGLVRLVRAGKQGEKESTYKIRRENGKEVSRRLIKTQILSQSVSRIIAKGTKEVVYGVGIATWFPAPAMTAAHNSLPRGTMVEVTNLKNGKSVVVKIIGGGIRSRAIIDLSPDAFSRLASLGTGVIRVKISQP
jgi:hypothetical protein